MNLGKALIERMLEVAYDVVVPIVERHVKKTTNTWDDKALNIFKKLLRDAIDGISDEDGD